MILKLSRNFLKWEKLGILLVMGLAFYLSFIPHSVYPYPVHVDEWVHFAHSQALIEEGNVIYIEPFLGESVLHHDSEVGFHLFLGVLHNITGISWLAIFKYFPSIIFLVIILSVYTLAQRKGYGLEAAFFVSLIPTTLRLLGPGFLTPLGLGVMFIPLCIFLAFNLRSKSSYILLFIFCWFLFYMHPPTALGVFIILFPCILLNLKRERKHSLSLIATLGITFLISLPQLFPLLSQPDESLVRLQYHYLPFPPPIFETYGYLPTLFFIAGVFLLARGGRAKDYALVFASVLLLIILLSFGKLQFGLMYVMYDRTHMYLMVLMGIIAGYALSKVKNIRVPRRFALRRRLGNNTNFLGGTLYLALIIPILIFSINSHLDTPYYHIINDQEYQDFVWIKQNLGDSYSKAILDPWKAMAFTPISQKNVYSRTPQGPRPSYEERNQEIYEFFSGECRDTNFLRENNISIVYTQAECNNPDLIRVKENIYLLREAQ